MKPSETALGFSWLPLWYLTSSFFFGRVSETPPLACFLILCFLWLGFELYFGAAEPIFRPRSPKWAWGPCALWLASYPMSWREHRSALYPVSLTQQWTVVSLFGLAGIARAVAMIQLGGLWSIDRTLRENPTLQTTGAYRWIRHPSYLALCVMATLPPVLLGNIAGFLFASLSVIPLLLHRVNAEEREQAYIFGQPFLDYQKRTFKIIPFVF